MLSFYNLRINIVDLRTDLMLFLNKKKYTEFLSGYKSVFENKTGLEIGGPSNIFSSEILPIYDWAFKVDGCNFSNHTIWEGSIESEDYNYYPNKHGYQFILEGTDLSKIADRSYDFVLSSHNLEHIANPLKALKEWERVIKPGGFILMILPDKRFTFDHKRPDTIFSHVLSDFENGVQEDDLSHLEEILNLHDLKMDPGAGRDFEIFKKRCEDNLAVRGMHHHIFSFTLLEQLLKYINMDVIMKYDVPPFHKIILARK